MDPYKVLGVSPNDSDDKIRQAYRELARKYHPDKYTDNPLSDLAEEKMKEINDAYDLITKQRKGDGSQNSSNDSYGGYSSGRGRSWGGKYSEVRMLISMGRLDEAYRLLDQVEQRDAQWHFLMGSLYYKRGMYDLAKDNFEKASSMDPNNAEYKAALDNMNNAGNVYRTGNYGGPAGCYGCSLCDVCAGLMCMDCLCNCC